VPRTTVYRVLNTLADHDVVRRTGEGAWRLGPRLLALAARVLPDPHGYDLAALARPHLERLAEATGLTAKLSVLDGDAALVVATAPGTREFALTVVPGQRLPLHAGAASKVLLAGLAGPATEGLLAGGLAAYTDRTLTDRRRLVRELAQVRRQGWAEDRGEYLTSVHALAAPVLDRAGRLVAAVSVPFLAGAAPDRVERLRAAVIATAGALAADLPGVGRGTAERPDARAVAGTAGGPSEPSAGAPGGCLPRSAAPC
jgi:DNA-binding IclR family transcriptional regulator